MSEVYKGDMVDARGNTCPEIVVCKIARGDTSELEAEARMHPTTLAKMHGPAVPSFIFYCSGTCEGRWPGTTVPVAALFTAYRGRPLSGQWADLPVVTRCAMLSPRRVRPSAQSRQFSPVAHPSRPASCGRIAWRFSTRECGRRRQRIPSLDQFYRI